MSSSRRPRRDWGHVRQLPSGRHQASYLLTGGVRVTAPDTFPSRRDADQWLAVERARLLDGGHVDPRAGQASVRQVVDRWIDSRRAAVGHVESADTGRQTLTLKTVIGYESVARTVICADGWGLGDVSVRDLKHGLVREWVEAAYLRFSTSRVAQAKRVLSAALREEVLSQRLISNPAAHVRTRTPRRSAHRILSPEEIHRYAREVEALVPGDGLLVHVLAWGGLRLGEALALAPRHLDLEAGGLRVERAAEEVRGRLGWKPPKDHEVRVVRLPRDLVSDLITHRGNMEAAGSPLLWPGPRTRTVDVPRRQGWMHRAWAPAADAAGLGPDPAGDVASRRSLRRSDLRPTCASLMHAAGATLAEIQRQLGHAPGSDVTMRVYTEVVEAAEQARGGWAHARNLTGTLVDRLDVLYREGVRRDLQQMGRLPLDRTLVARAVARPNRVRESLPT